MHSFEKSHIAPQLRTCVNTHSIRICTAMQLAIELDMRYTYASVFAKEDVMTRLHFSMLILNSTRVVIAADLTDVTSLCWHKLARSRR